MATGVATPLTPCPPHDAAGSTGFRLRLTLALELLRLITTAGTLKLWNTLRWKLAHLQRER
jgi:hypothetical protein